MLIQKRTRAARRSLQRGALIAVLCGGSPAYAEPADAERTAAAREFDAGLSYFDNADYEAAARAFLRADLRLPNSEAIANAITAAKRASNYLLVAEAAERGVSRQDTDPGLAATARQALAEAARHLARVDIQCEPRPCELTLDGASVAPGATYVLPGMHVFAATGPASAHAQETQTLAAGTTYRVVLHPVPPGGGTTEATGAIMPPLEAPASGAEDRAAGDEAVPSADGEPIALHPAWFYAGAALTTGLLAVTVWSGINTLSAKDDLPDKPKQEDIGSVRSKAIRTDVFLGATVLLGAATTYVGLELVDWGEPTSQTAVVVVPGGAMISTRHSF